MKKRVGALAGLFVVATAAIPPTPEALAQPEAILEGRAVLPADTFAGPPPSGAELEDETKGGHTPPFEGQPVGGISAVLEAGDGEFQAMPDNGFGKKDNSPDFQLRTYRISPNFETANGGSGEISIGEFVQLRDPDRQVPFEITNEQTDDRLLTGADFDVESVRRDALGDLWFGDEFGPFLLHTDATGRVLEAPIPLPGVKSPENPNLGPEEEPNLPTSKGFEGMAISEDGTTLYPMLEGALKDEGEANRRYVYEFDPGAMSYTGERWWYSVEAPDNSIGDFTALGVGRFLVIERDNEQGEEAGFKKVYEVDLSREDSEGYLAKREVLDLLSIRDPYRISEPAREGDIGLGDPFSFPFQTIESILPLEDGRLLLLNDNNYPLSAGRNPDQPDDTEAVIMRTGTLSPSTTEMPSTGGPSLPVLVSPMLMAIVGAAWLLLQRRVTAITVVRSP